MSAPKVAELEARVAALEGVVTRLALAVADAFGDRAEQARSLWEKNQLYELTEPLSEDVREEAFQAWNEENRAESDDKV